MPAAHTFAALRRALNTSFHGRPIFALVASFCLGPLAFAQLPGPVTYSPPVQPIQGNQPLVAAPIPSPTTLNPYYLSITSATNLVFPLDVTLTASVLQKPDGVSDATAVGFVSFSPATLRFTGPSQVLQTIVSVNVPLQTSDGTRIEAGTYAWKITGNWPSDVTDPGATINAVVNPPISDPTPLITTHPASVTVYVGAAASFSVAATAPVAPTFQWQKNGDNIVGATGSTYTISAAALSDASSYRVVVSNAVTSNAAALTVLKRPQTINFGVLAPKTYGSPPFTLSATATSGLPVSYASSDPGVATVSGNVVTLVAPGTTLITASQDGDARYNPAAPVSQALLVQLPSVCGTAIVRHAPELSGNAGVDGSLQVLLAENIGLNGNVWISKDLLVPGKPAIKIHGHPTVGGMMAGTGEASPSNHTITLNGNPVVGHIVWQTNPIVIPGVDRPPVSGGTRDVKLNTLRDSAGNFATVRDLAINGGAGQVMVPPGTYRDLTANGDAGFTLGDPAQPTVYYVRNLRLNGTGDLKIVGPVTLVVTDDVNANGKVGNFSHSDWLTLNLFDGDLTLSGKAHLHGRVLAPNGKVRLNGKATLCGGLMCSELRIDGNGLLNLCACDEHDRDD